MFIYSLFLKKKEIFFLLYESHFNFDNIHK